MKNVIFYCNQDQSRFIKNQNISIQDIVKIRIHIELNSLFETLKKVPIDAVIFFDEVSNIDQKEINDMILSISQTFHNKETEIIYDS